jgi:hypothetical protein
MRKRSYLNTESKQIQGYSKKSSYIVDDDRDSLRKYSLLPEEYDMFSELDPAFFTRKETRQQKLISTCLFYMKECLLDFYNSHGIVCILPKLIYTQDDEGTITFSMALSAFRAFMSFEGEKGDYDAYYGVVSQTDEDSVSSETKKLTYENYESAIQSFLQILINNA